MRENEDVIMAEAAAIVDNDERKAFRSKIGDATSKFKGAWRYSTTKKQAEG